MKVTFENQGTHTYLVYEINDEDAIDSMSLGMLTNNKIPGLAHALYTQLDTKRYVKYDVSAKVSVSQFFSGPVNKKRLLGVFHGIVDAMLSAEDYMIDVNTILLDLDYIFADVSTCETVLICIPVEKEPTVDGVDFGSFFKNIMFNTQFDPTENCDHVAQLMNYLNSVPVFSLEEFKKLLDAVSSGVAQQAAAPQRQQPVVPKAPVPQAPVQIQAQQPVQAPIQQPVQAPIQQPVQAPIQQPVQAPIQQAVPSAPQRPVQPQPQVQAPKKNQRSTQPAPNRMPPAPPARAAVNTPMPQRQNPVPANADGQKMSFFYLMQHYNKENAELYKAQKEARKNGQTVPLQNVAPTPVAPKAKKPQQAGFAIPGQAAPQQRQGFAIPGQPTPPIQKNPVGAQQPVAQRPVQQQPAMPQQQVQPAPVQQPTYVPSPVPQGQPMNFGETTVLGGGSIGETTVLGASAAVKTSPHLIRIKNNEKINLNKPVFRIGKEKSYVDYFIGDNSAISRSHANIISRDGHYLVVDTNSTNHTYVNGGMIQSNVETPVSHGTKIKLANEEFEFRLY